MYQLLRFNNLLAYMSSVRSCTNHSLCKLFLAYIPPLLLSSKGLKIVNHNLKDPVIRINNLFIIWGNCIFEIEIVNTFLSLITAHIILVNNRIFKSILDFKPNLFLLKVILHLRRLDPHCWTTRQFTLSLPNSRLKLRCSEQHCTEQQIFMYREGKSGYLCTL